jgi:uncharacterized protein YciI
MTDESYFLYTFTPHRPTFHLDMTPEERATMAEHVAYWKRYVDDGRVIIYGPVADPKGGWGLAIIRAGSADEVLALGADDPARGLGTFGVFPMPRAIVRE